MKSRGPAKVSVIPKKRNSQAKKNLNWLVEFLFKEQVPFPRNLEMMFGNSSFISLFDY